MRTTGDSNINTRKEHQDAQNVSAVFQFFYHCKGEELPVRDVLNTNGKGHKTEPHYENLTENWCSKCMRQRIASANRLQVEYLFLLTTYNNPKHRLHGKRLVVGFLHRAQPKIWEKLNHGIQSGARGFDPSRPEACEFFAGDAKSHFVSAENAYLLDNLANCRWKYFSKRKETMRIVARLRKSPSILPELRNRVKNLAKQIGFTQPPRTFKNKCHGC